MTTALQVQRPGEEDALNHVLDAIADGKTARVALHGPEDIGVQVAKRIAAAAGLKAFKTQYINDRTHNDLEEFEGDLLVAVFWPSKSNCEAADKLAAEGYHVIFATKSNKILDSNDDEYDIFLREYARFEVDYVPVAEDALLRAGLAQIARVPKAAVVRAAKGPFKLVGRGLQARADVIRYVAVGEVTPSAGVLMMFLPLLPTFIKTDGDDHKAHAVISTMMYGLLAIGATATICGGSEALFVMLIAVAIMYPVVATIVACVGDDEADDDSIKCRADRVIARGV